VVTVADRDRGDVVALMYEIGGRYRTGDDRREFEVYAGDLAETSGPVAEGAARLAYQARRDRLNARRGAA
jgi:hypothetical protein